MTDSDIKNLAYDISKEYNIYYEGGEKSIYNKRFGNDKVIFHEKYLIKTSITKLIKRLTCIKDVNSYHLKVLDFGCGDGRLFELLESIANSYKSKKIYFEITALDISLTGLEEYVKKLQAKNFNFTSYIDYSKDNNSYLYSSMYKDNIKIDFIRVNPDDKIEEIEILKNQKFHLNLCLFSVLSHVNSKQRRMEILNSFNKVADKNALSILTVPGKKCF